MTDESLPKRYGKLRRDAKLFRRGSLEETLYHVWYNMIDRCTNKRHPAYARYGGRGVTVCADWQTFVVFLEWAVKDYKFGLWLDRENPNKDYYPLNCRWITPNESRDNLPNSCIITAFGETKTASKWTKDSRCVVSRDTLRARIIYGYEPEKAIITPVGKLYR